MCFSSGGSTPPPPPPPPPVVDQEALDRQKRLEAEREKKAKGRQSTILTEKDQKLGEPTNTGDKPDLLGN